MENSINVKWDSNMKFVTEVDHHELVLDAGDSVGGQNLGPRPKTLLMVGLAGCTGMDVISILKKMKVDVSYFNIKIEAELSDEHPKKYLSMKVIYEVKGSDVEFEKVKKAVDLSVDKYCGVYANFKDAMKLDYEIRIL